MNIKKLKRLSKLPILILAFSLLNIGIVGAMPIAHGQSSFSNVIASSDIKSECGQNSQDNCSDCTKVAAGDCSIIDDLVVAINFLAAGVGIVVVIMIVIGGIEYTTSADNPQSVASARKKIINALIALVSFIFLYAFLNFIIPGGVF
jgi:hypothetical protein